MWKSEFGDEFFMFKFIYPVISYSDLTGYLTRFKQLFYH